MLRQGNVKLIGEPFPELALGANPAGPVAQLGQGFLAGHLNAALANQQVGNAAFARIYGFSFEGHYYDLPRPVLILVDGPGNPVALPDPSIRQTDEAAHVWDFSGQLFEWNYDKMSMTIRLDLDSGTLHDILLARALGDRASASGSGAYGSGAYGSGAYGSGAYGSGAYGSGAYGSGAYGRGRKGGCD